VEAEKIATLKHDPRLETIQKRAAELVAKLPNVQIAVPPPEDVPGLEIRLDGVPIDRFFLIQGPLATTAGAHVVDASAPGKVWSQRVDAKVGEHVVATVRLSDASRRETRPPTPTPTATPTPTPAPTPAPRSSTKIVGLLVGAVGVAALGFGATAGVVALGKRSAAQNLCGGDLRSCSGSRSSVDDDLSTGRTWATVSTVGVIVGALAVASGAFLFFTANATTDTKPTNVASALVKGVSW
jgi:hypothetical protein